MAEILVAASMDTPQIMIYKSLAPQPLYPTTPTN